MKYPLDDTKAPEQTVSLAKKLGLNPLKHLSEKLKSEILQDLAAYNEYVAKNGSPAELARAHYAGADDAT